MDRISCQKLYDAICYMCMLQHGVLVRQSCLQIIPWARMDKEFLVSPPSQADKTDDVDVPEKQPVPGRTGGKSTTTWIFPLMYAVELRQPTWLMPMIASAKACLLLDAQKIKGTQLDMSFPDAAAQTELSPQAKQLAAHKMLAWVNATIGSGNPPTALYR